MSEAPQRDVPTYRSEDGPNWAGDIWHVPFPTSNQGAAAEAAVADKYRLQLNQAVLREKSDTLDQLMYKMYYADKAALIEMDDIDTQIGYVNQSVNENPTPTAVRAAQQKIELLVQQKKDIYTQLAELDEAGARQAQEFQREFGNILKDNLMKGGKTRVQDVVDFTPMDYAKGKDAYTNPDGYINAALDAAGITDPTARANWTNGLLVGASRQSSDFDPGAVNTTDRNFHGPLMADGKPLDAGRGTFTMNPETFARHHLAGTSTDIYDPVANTASTINYLQKHYGVLPDGSNLSKVQQFNPNLRPKGF